MNEYKTNVIDSKYRGDSMSELNRLKDCRLEQIEELKTEVNNKTITDAEYFESLFCEYEKLSELQEMVIHLHQLRL